MKLPSEFYQHHHVIEIAKSLLGKYLFTCIDDTITGGFIAETEAYNGVIDKASHAFGGRFTNRTQVIYQEGGIAYVYLCYGIHEMFNIVTATEGTPHAILIRAIEPIEGIDIMLHRRKMVSLKPNITSGPGSVAKALGISRNINGCSLQSDTIWLEDRGLIIADEGIVETHRIGVQYAENDAFLPYRFYIHGNRYVSRPIVHKKT